MKCSTPYCHRQRTKYRKLCGTCRQRNYRKNNPMRSAFQNLRCNSRARGIYFGLTFEQFEAWAIEVTLLIGYGRSAQSFTVDRKNPHLGYIPGNIQKITNRQNVLKQKYIDPQWNPLERKMEFKFVGVSPIKLEELKQIPF